MTTIMTFMPWLLLLMKQMWKGWWQSQQDHDDEECKQEWKARPKRGGCFGARLKYHPTKMTTTTMSYLLFVTCHKSWKFENIPTHNHRKRTKQKDVKMTTKSVVWAQPHSWS
jgi:hypothetical protein